MTTIPTPFTALSRDTALLLLRTALAVGEGRYARRVAQAWLANYPGDLQIGLLHARAIILEEETLAHHLATGHRSRAGSDHATAIRILETICQVDPEFLEAQQLLAQLSRVAALPLSGLSSGAVLALEGHLPRQAHGLGRAPNWALRLHAARKAYQRARSQPRHDQKSITHHLDQAEKLVHQALCDLSPESNSLPLAESALPATSSQPEDGHPSTPLAAITHLQICLAKPDYPPQALQVLANMYHTQWPECLQFTLLLADFLMDTGQEEDAVALLHLAVSQDSAGQVAQRLWGPAHPYRALWPDQFEIQPGQPGCPQEIPIPASVTAALGWNQLPRLVPLEAQGTPAVVANRPSVQPASPIAQPAGAVVYPSAKHAHPPARPADSATRDGRFPVYVILTTRLGLQTQFGVEALPILDQEMQRLAAAVRHRQFGYHHWGAQVIYVDVPQDTAAFGLQSAPHNDPWRIKLFLNDLDQALGKRGERIGALLIVGGPEVVPFHLLPNPVEDDDHEVPSDNPYASRDENYFAPEWPVGRLPAGHGPDPQFLRNALRAAVTQHSTRPIPLPQRLWRMIQSWLHPNRPRPSFGYTAAIWRRASFSVFRTIGEPRSLLVSPPVQACDLPVASRLAASAAQIPTTPGQATACLTMPSARLAYFNLHGLPDAIEWYGQRDPTESSITPDYPIALRPQDIRNGGHAPQVVFSEACYGAHILEKQVDEAISLKFLEAGSQAVVGSTCISYGSVGSPLIAADLLGRLFWNFLNEGYMAGEALRRAKWYLAHEMHRRQGYLDSEDQKTLISFVLYGDPLAQPYPSRRASKAPAQAASLPQPIQAACGRNLETPGTTIPPQVLARVRQVVSHYLPTMTDANITISQERPACTASCQACTGSGECLAQQSNSPNNAGAKARHKIQQHQVVTLSKQTEQAAVIHKQYARLRLDPSGKVLKIVVSR